MSTNNLEKTKAKEKFKNEMTKWAVRRRMAILSFIADLIICLFYMVVPIFLSGEQAESLAQFNSIVITLISFFTTNVMVYVGAATYYDKVTHKDVEVEKEVR